MEEFLSSLISLWRSQLLLRSAARASIDGDAIEEHHGGILTGVALGS
jgi:hypothetical protein